MSDIKRCECCNNVQSVHQNACALCGDEHHWQILPDEDFRPEPALQVAAQVATPAAPATSTQQFRRKGRR